jgi:hypothetical protein
MRQIFNDPALQQAFLHPGYVHVPMLSAAEVNYILEGLKGLRPDDKFAPTGRSGFLFTYHCSFLDTNTTYKRATNQLIRSVFEPHVKKYLHGYNILNCNFYVKPPGTGEFAIHQNWPAIADLNDTTVTIWCPLGDVVESNGTLQFVEGSHKIVPHVEGPNCPGYFQNFKQALIDKYLKPLPLNAGEALIFDDGLIHWSARNNSTEPRIAIQILCTPVDVPSVYFYYDPKSPEKFELIEVNTDFFIESDVTQLCARQPEWKSLGFVENKNRFLTEEEFVTLLGQGDQLRHSVYNGGPHHNGAGTVSVGQ